MGLTLARGTPAQEYIGRPLKELDFDECLVALVLRDGVTLVPHGETVLKDMDRLTIVGQAKDIERLRARLRLSGAPQPDDGG
jgi:Trk K+ transport system NAD-binding subunit